MFWARPLSREAMWKALQFPKSRACTRPQYEPLFLRQDDNGYNRIRHIYLLVNFLLMFIYLGFVAYGAVAFIEGRQGKGLIHSPVRPAVSYETRVIDQSILSPFHHSPSLEADIAWHSLIKYNNAVIQQRDLDKLNRTSVLLRDGSGFLASVDVFHELHCLNYVRQNVSPEYYKLESKAFRDEHLFHCIDAIRTILMCHADISVHTFEWTNTSRVPLMKPQALHECRKWEPIVKWAEAHTPSRAHGPILENPELGEPALSYRNYEIYPNQGNDCWHMCYIEEETWVRN